MLTKNYLKKKIKEIKTRLAEIENIVDSFSYDEDEIDLNGPEYTIDTRNINLEKHKIKIIDVSKEVNER